MPASPFNKTKNDVLISLSVSSRFYIELIFVGSVKVGPERITFG